MNRLIDNAIRVSENLRRNDMVEVTIITKTYGDYDPDAGLEETPIEIKVKATSQRVDSHEMKDTDVQIGDTKLLIRSSLIGEIDINLETEVKIDNISYEVIYTYIDSSKSLRILYVR